VASPPKANTATELVGAHAMSDREGVALRGLCPNVLRIILHAVALREFDSFAVERHAFMMLLLRSNEFDNGLYLRFADGKRTVAVLPVEVAVIGVLRIDPFRRIRV
jgi:hypothetical protein